MVPNEPGTLTTRLRRNKGRFGNLLGIWSSGRIAVIAWQITLCVALLFPVAVHAQISATDARLYREAFNAAEAGRFSEARQIARRAREQLPMKVIDWMDLTRSDTDADWETLNQFLVRSADWPNQSAIRRNAEARMPDLPAQAVREWFERRPPLTTQGFVRFADALMDTGASDKGIALVRDRYINGTFGIVEERDFRKRFNSLLRPQDHIARLDRLLWDEDADAAKRVMPLVDKGQQNVALARLALAGMAGGADSALRKVPPSLQSNPGLQYERLRWRRRKDMDAAALEILAKPPRQLIRPDAWWTERHIMARRLIENGKHQQAYNLVRNHGAVDGLSFAQAEFLAGWLALRFVNRPNEAVQHFEALYRGVTTPLSKGRGAYWAARAYDAAGTKDKATLWFETALAQGPTFYGMLATDQLGLAPGAAIVPPAIPDPASADSFAKRDLVRLVRMLDRIEEREKELTGQFLRRLVADASTDTEWRLLGTITAGMDDLRLAVHAGRQAVQSGRFLPEGYPVLTKSLPARPEPAFIHAIIRQESSFDRGAVSSAGARGLMQLMPGTAQHLAKGLRLRHNADKLTSDGSYNVLLGAAYLQEMIDRYDGSYVLAAAAYNAGPGRVSSWIKTYGDPRQGVIDPIDWIELIPFTETRNYVQRVIENAQIYRTRLGTTPVRMTDELRRGIAGAG